MRRVVTALAGAVLALSLATACGSDGGLDPSSAPTAGKTRKTTKPAQADSPAPATSDAPSVDPPADDPSGPPFPEGTDAQTAENSGDWDLVLTGVRVGRHDDFDRIVLDFRGSGVPGWGIDYVDEPVLEGSGEVVDLAGDTVLNIGASGTTYPESEQDWYDGPQRLEPDATKVREVYVGGTFEGYTQVLVGLDGDRTPFRVFALASPARLVVDVRTD